MQFERRGIIAPIMIRNKRGFSTSHILNFAAIDCNVLDDNALINLVDKTIEKFGSIEILVNNVGGGGAGKESPYDIEVAQF